MVIYLEVWDIETVTEGDSMAIVQRVALILLESKCELYKPVTKADGVTANDPFPKGLRYVISVSAASGYKGGALQDRGTNPADPSYCYEKITINIEEDEIEEVKSGRKAYRDSDGEILSLDQTFWKIEAI